MESFSNNQLLQEIKSCEELLTDRIADNMETFGVSSTVGRLLGIIYMNREAMTLDSLAEETGMSKTRMSQVMRQMISFNIAEKEYVKGSRKDHYNVERDYAQTFISLFTSNWSEVVKRNTSLERRLREQIRHLETFLTEDSSEEVKVRMERLQQELDEWNAYYNWINNLVAFFESGEIFNHVPIVTPTKKEEAKNEE
ncbi:HTH-type transcriptional repressor OpcR [Oceanobacillus oncorhynchi subsp. incaldanensis]|uniref:HTH-type transcriptional regulator n=2 Tax=Oceanobacillus TaxID=182709 RepID=A0A0A1MDZ0_9BACI|nr:GbsR/MarR family transcriptional regulator [Oceanobacillus oncorhynchi]MDM8101908.1 GbsR/MarR family transcriptional regulator [Oceanobacillus oncorhynchi]UUI42067.1 GbsR/MarR family transcriptional regulator [Oceanobacillus oncorhynchi]GIO17366.1 HTH-type transcriptional repressor OpcR [Oceanobacillus oncorhynchi subsp. incaldanensis]CEI83590.1 HTH-type transcriptional repressor OpcR [Oceanobacillus oncorhynchi]